DFSQALIGKWNPHKGSLSAVDTASQRPASVRVGAVVDITMLTEKAAAAEGLHIDGDTIAWFEVGDGTSDRFHHTHHLMSDGDSWHCARNRAMFDVQIARTDARQRHLDNGVSRILQRWLWFLHELKLSFFYIGIC